MTDDQILKDLVIILKKETRVSDIPVRYGGEEFAIILPNTNEVNSINIAEKIRMSVETAIWRLPSVTVSIGVATTIFGDTKRSIQTRADQALYASKESGRNTVTHSSYYNFV